MNHDAFHDFQAHTHDAFHDATHFSVGSEYGPHAPIDQQTYTHDMSQVLDDLHNTSDTSTFSHDLNHLIDEITAPPALDYMHGATHPIDFSHGTGQPDEHYIIGHPDSDVRDWHLQQHSDTCAVVSQEFVLDNLTGHHFSENELRQEAITHGWYTPNGGTPFDDIGKLLELHGVHVTHEHGASLQQLEAQLQAGHHVIAAVNGHDIWDHLHDNAAPLQSYPGIPGQKADHAVEVIGVDTSNPHNPMVILNDPGTLNGQGLEVPASTFMQAWSTSDNLMVHTDESTPHAPSAGGYDEHGDWWSWGVDQYTSVPFFEPDPSSFNIFPNG